MSAELPLSTKTLLVLNPSIMSMMTNRSSWGCFTPLASSSEKYISWPIHLCFRGGRLWTLFTCLWYDFLRELNDPLVMVFISPIVLCGRGGMWSSSLREPSWWSLLPSLNLLKFPFFRYFCSFPLHMNSFICSLGPGNPLCNARDPCENGNISSYRAH